MRYLLPIYTLRHAFEARPIACAFGLAGVLATIPRLAPDLYFVDLAGIEGDEPWETVATAAVHESGEWTLNLSDGTEFQGRTENAREMHNWAN